MESTNIANILSNTTVDNYSTSSSVKNAAVDDSFANIYDNLTSKSSKSDTSLKTNYADKSENTPPAVNQTAGNIQNAKVTKSVDTAKVSLKNTKNSNSDISISSDTKQAQSVQDKTSVEKRSDIEQNIQNDTDTIKSDTNFENDDMTNQESETFSVSNEDTDVEDDVTEKIDYSYKEIKTEIPATNTLETEIPDTAGVMISESDNSDINTSTVFEPDYELAENTNNQPVVTSVESQETKNDIDNKTTAKVANEQILANVEFEEDLSVESDFKVQQDSDSVDLSRFTKDSNIQQSEQSIQTQKTVKNDKLIFDAKDKIAANISSQKEQIEDSSVQDLDVQADFDTETSNIKKVDNNTTEVNVQQKTSDVKNKITINLQSQNPAFEERIVDDSNLKIENTDVDVDEEQVLIRANVTDTEEVKAAVKVDDIPEQVKDKAVNAFKSIDSSASVESSMSNTDSNSENSFTRGNANEDIIKMSINNDSESIPQAVDAFGAKIDKNAFGKVLNNTQNNSMFNKSDIMNQINAKFSELQNGTNSKVTIVLRPENLGRIHLEIVNSSEGITARMATENQQVKDLLDKNMDALRASLNNQGVNVNTLRVENTSQSSNAGLGFEQEQFNHNSNNPQQGEKRTNDRASSTLAGYSREEGELEPEHSKEVISGFVHDGKVDYMV